MKRTALTKKELKKHLHYNPRTGIFTRLITRSGNAKAGTVAGCDNGEGYLTIMVLGTSYKSHRLAWLYMTGKWPYEIDHKDGKRANNKWKNLREVNDRMQSENKRGARSDNLATGLLGVVSRRNRFEASIQVRGKKIWIGSFQTAIEAHNAYIKSKREFHEGNTL